MWQSHMTQNQPTIIIPIVLYNNFIINIAYKNIYYIIFFLFFPLEAYTLVNII